jgi:hypothetical protein
LLISNIAGLAAAFSLLYLLLLHEGKNASAGKILPNQALEALSKNAGGELKSKLWGAQI